MEQDKNTKKQFVPDYRIAKLSGIGILGFIIGCVFLFYNDIFTITKNDSVFHELTYQPRIYADSLITHAIDSLNRELATIKEEIEKYRQATTPDSLKKRGDLLENKTVDSVIIKQLSLYKQYFEDVSEIDTIGFNALNKALHFQITPAAITKWDSLFRKQKYTWKNDVIVLDSVYYYFKDPKIPIPLKGKAAIKPVRPASDIAFITKYPSSGIWLILVLVFCSFCFIAISTTVHLKEKVLKVFKDEEIEGLPKRRYYGICVWTALVMGLMALIWNRTFYDAEIVKDVFFMKTLSTSMTWVITLGSVAGAFCLAGFVYTASMLNYFAEPLRKMRREVADQKSLVQKSQLLKVNTDADKKVPEGIPTPEQILLMAKEAEEGKQEIVFQKLVKIFRTYFVLAAAILCLVILCTGALFSTINSLDFTRLLADDWGYSPVRSDFIYLYGGLYTIILLLVYVPAKMRFSETDIWVKQPVPVENGKWYDVLKNPFGPIKDVLVATSPLIVSIVQSLIDILFT